MKISNYSKLCAKISWHPPINDAGRTASCIAFGLIATYLWVLPTEQTIALRHLVFFPLVLLTLWSAWRHKLRLYVPLAMPWLIYGTIALFSLTYAIDSVFSLREIKKEIGYSMLILIVTATWVRNIASLDRLMAIIIIGNVAMVGSALLNVAIYTFSQTITVQYIDISNQLYSDVGNFSTYLVTVSPLIAVYTLMQPRTQRKIKFALFSLLVLDILVLFLTRNRMGMIVLTTETIIIIGFLLIKRTEPASAIRNLLIALTFIAITGGLLKETLQLHPLINDDRMKIWANAITHIQANPLTGGGFGRTVLKLIEQQSNPHYSGYDHSHNLVLNKGIQMGIPGIAAFLFLMGMTLRASWPPRTMDSDHRLQGYAFGITTMTLGVFLKSMTDDFFVNNNALLYWALLGSVLGTLAESKKKLHSSKQINK